jgi:hypothetical protein
MKRVILISVGALLCATSLKAQTGTLSWDLNGNSNTIPTSSFLGTTINPYPLRFMAYQRQRMIISPFSGFVGIGLNTPKNPLHVHSEWTRNRYDHFKFKENEQLEEKVERPLTEEEKKELAFCAESTTTDPTTPTGTPMSYSAIQVTNCKTTDAVDRGLLLSMEDFNSYLRHLEEGESSFNIAVRDKNVITVTNRLDVGIGTTSPNAKLHVLGNALFSNDVNVGGTLQIGSSTLTCANNKLSFNASNGYTFNSTYGNIDFNVNNSTRLSFRGNDGGNIYIPFNVNLTFGSEIGDGFDRLRILHTGIHGYIDYKDNLHFRADKNWISALTLYGNGSVGVGFGTTYNAGQYLNMGYKLAVNGGIICEEVKVIVDVPDADYVFEEDYQLPSLTEVENFIKENKHLPNIPSAEEFKTNGYKVGDMDEMLLRKIEEMTLYIIELQKQIDELKQQKGGE